MGIWQFIAGGGDDEDGSIIESAKREAFEEAVISETYNFFKIDTCCSNFIRILALIVVCFHWFNPFAWLMLKLLYSDIELACDESVLSKCDEAERKEYAYTLLSTAEKTNLFVASFGGSKIRIRIENILSYSKISIFSIVSFAALVIAICYVLLTNA